MKAFKVEILVIDREGQGAAAVKDEFENTRYGDHCISQNVMNVTEADIGDWSDDHPLNCGDTMKEEYERLFPVQKFTTKYANEVYNTSRGIKTPATHPDHQVVGHYFAAHNFERSRNEIYFCDSYDPRVDYFMTNVNYPDERRDVSVRAIGKTWQEAEDRGTHWFVPTWSLRIEKDSIAIV